MGIISGFLIEEYKIIFWVISFPLLIFVVIGYYVADNRKRVFHLSNKIKKFEETLNIYDRLNKIENKLKMKKRGQSIDLIEIIKWGLAILLIYIFIKVILSLN